MKENDRQATSFFELELQSRKASFHMLDNLLNREEAGLVSSSEVIDDMLRKHIAYLQKKYY